ncbi:ankyrin repeat and protein kinase domain-containing protein 1-like isoform X2 [Periplaneta americana]|uniref:ankyrin repeat and protein kinase domain-containing protein 1-like isoform X2 n=1 Tax=Periplaneta americana TaxID=6978 RepID=UPI0037E87671
MAKPNPIPDLQRRVKALEGQVRQPQVPLLAEIKILKERLDALSIHSTEARSEDEVKGKDDTESLGMLQESLKSKQKELEEKERELIKQEEELEKGKELLQEMTKKYEKWQLLRLHHDYVGKSDSREEELRNLRAQLEAERRLLRQQEVSKIEELEKLRQELEVKFQLQRQQEAVNDCRAVVLRLLREVGADLERADCSGRTLLHRAADQGSADAVQVLLDAGSAVNAVDSAGCTPLYLAAQRSHQDACRALLAAGARPDLKARSLGWTPLHRAAWWGHAPVVQLLLQHGAERGLRDQQGRTALDLARECGNREVESLLYSRVTHNE